MSVLWPLAAAVLAAAAAVRVLWPYAWAEAPVVWRVLFSAVRIAWWARRRPPTTMLELLVQRARRSPGKTLVVFEGRALSYGQLDADSSRLGRAVRAAAGLGPGDCAALLLPNGPLFLAAWFGLAKLGCAAAFLNTNSRRQALLHCLRCSGSRVLLTAADLWSSVEEVLPALRNDNVTVFVLDGECTAEGVENLKDKIQAASDQPLPLSLRSAVTFQSPFVYIFTSGTTGLPKAAIINHLRAHRMASFMTGCGLCSSDVLYTTLPLYHSSGSLLGICAAISVGATVVLRRKFSASQFWDDCRKYNVTVFQYIGELLRYLCNVPKRSNEQEHKVRIAVGNGARADVWKEFINRFGNIHICEFYGATEGNIGFMNYVGKIGAAGRINFISKRLLPFHLVKYDAELEAPVRDANGYCIEVATGEVGLLIAKITPKTPFTGYVRNEVLTEKKRLRDVFCKGDVYFNSGDLMMVDHDNFIYFQDRIGDTFRWKGENVATIEVADVFSTLDFVQNACVYGVTVPGHEGRIGMAAIQLHPGKDWDGERLYEHVVAHLPSYARPRFLRQQRAIETTGTFKYYKVTLVKEGFNPTTVQDSLFILDDEKRAYVPMDQEAYQSVINNLIRL
ncbi:long-chain fatty acid transport protein 2-like isoform X1 [Pristis pectinata]|uniref:long-chain fatty acid transport protein 2-like isoform X1 n=1 Tax=Pristis pectinata TaxID=685728 RepID=UPI00223DEBBE|nr:long-chain fatty acid transport protein 2-like isoform X1 [Pristis pectinata]XP_051896131.1 long-chain fatty acid transport protein 2-like isoform X1 [Pristis pectinata]